MYSKKEASSSTQTNNKRNIVDSTTRCPSPPATPLMAQLMEMGFSKKAVEIALKATNEVSENSANIEQLVAWLLEYSEECQLVADCLTSLEKEGSNKTTATKVRL